MTDETAGTTDLDANDSPVAEFFVKTRPVPDTEFRAGLARHLAQKDPGWGARPAQLWPQAIALIVAGAVLLIIGGLITTGGI